MNYVYYGIQQLLHSARDLHTRQLPVSKLMRHVGPQVVLSLRTIWSHTSAAKIVFDARFGADQKEKGWEGIPADEKSEFLSE